MCTALSNEAPHRFSYRDIKFSVTRFSQDFLTWANIEMEVLELNDENFGSAVGNAMHINHQLFVAAPTPLFFAVRDLETQLHLVLHQRVYGEHVDVIELFAQMTALKEQLLQADQTLF